jgi:coenzyme PQQ precursor peptide PqqA
LTDADLTAHGQADSLAMNIAKWLEGSLMAWKTPKIIEIALGAEINSYACADLT